MPATWQFYPQKMVFPAMPVQTWESFAYLASRIKDWKIRRSSSKPEKSKNWAFSGNRSLVCLPATIKVLLLKGLTSTHMWNFSRLETNFTGKKSEFSVMSALKPENAEFSKVFCKTTLRILLTSTGIVSLKQRSLVRLLKTEVTGWTGVWDKAKIGETSPERILLSRLHG